METKTTPDYWNMTAESLQLLTKEDCLDFIRYTLQYPELRHCNHTTEHHRFNMTGYDNNTSGSNVIENQSILYKFAYLGIYDYTQYLFMDFYKGTPVVYLAYWLNEEHYNWDLLGYTTSEIIYFIFEKTIFSGKTKRRRN